MPLSKNSIFIFFSLTCVVSSLFVVSCRYADLKQRDIESRDHSTFIVDPPTGKLLASNESTQTIVAKQWEFSVCVKDNNRELAIPNAPFEIVFPDNSSLAGNSDEEGCVVWRETFHFNKDKKPQYVNLEREVHSLGIHRGSEKFTVTFNPWLANESDAQVVEAKSIKETPLSEEEFNAETSSDR